MPRKVRKPKPSEVFGPLDRKLLELIRSHDLFTRAALCTLARRGIAFRLGEPERAAEWIDRLSPHPIYKGGQFLFDLLEWEDFMLEGLPPPYLTESEIAPLLRRIAEIILG